MNTLAVPTWRTTTAYDGAGRPRLSTPPNGWAPPAGTRADWQQTTHHDALGRLTKRTAPDSGTAEAVYDDLGRVRFAVDGDGAADAPTNPAPGAVAIRYAKYDRLGRMIERGWITQPAWDRAALENKANTDWPTDCPTWRERRHYDHDGDPAALGEGHLVRAETRQDDGRMVVETATYDRLGRLASRATSVPDGHVGRVAYRHDRAGRLCETSLPTLTAGAPLTLTRHYDAWGRCRAIAAPEETLADYAWHPDGQPARERLGGGLIDNALRYASHGDLAAIDGNLFQQTLHYNDPPSGADGMPIAPPRRNGLLSARTETLAGSAPNAQGYRWDGAHQLLGARDPAGSTETYAYDANGNLRGRGTRTFGYQGTTNRLTAADGRPGAWTYSPAGHLTASPEWAFAYDFATGLVTRVADPTRALDLTYGATSQRLVKTWRDGAHTATRRYLPGSGDRAAVETWQLDAGPVQQVRLLEGPLGPFALLREAADGTPSLAYLLRDHRRSVRALVNETGILERHGYHPFGAAANDDDQTTGQATYRFTGQEWDAETGLYNYRRRLYDPDVQRFLGPDPAGQYHSPYLYVANNPLQYLDPDGQWSLKNTIGSAVSGLEIVAGVGILVVSGGTATVAGGALIGAGVAGLGYTAQDRNGMSWRGFAVAQGVGAFLGALGGAGAAADEPIEAVEEQGLNRAVEPIGQQVVSTGNAIPDVGDFDFSDLPLDDNNQMAPPNSIQELDRAPRAPVQRPEPPPVDPNGKFLTNLGDATPKGRRYIAQKTIAEQVGPNEWGRARGRLRTPSVEESMLTKSFADFRVQIPEWFK